MANPTTNYGFVLPTPTDLVTDLPADFDVALQGVDTRLKALEPGTTLGDLAFSSATANTNTRLGIGSTSQVLTVAGGVPSWATPTSSLASYSLLNSGGTALTGSATITISGISAKNDLFIIVTSASSANASSEFSIRFNADTAANYFQVCAVAYAQTTASQDDITVDSGNTTSLLISRMSGNASSIVKGIVQVTGANTAGIKMVDSQTASNGATANFAAMINEGGYWNNAATVSSVSIISSTGNFDAGTIYIYGA